MIEIAALFAVLDLKVGQRGMAARAPIGDALAAIDKPLLVEIDESRAHGAAGAVVERERRAGPVAGCADALNLFIDAAAVLIDPLPDALYELIAAEVVARNAVGGKHALDDDLSGDAGVVGAGQIQRRFAAHAMPAHNQVFDRDSERVSHMEFARHIGRRHNDGEGLLGAVDPRREVAAVQPEIVDAPLDCLGFVSAGDVC